MVIDTFKPPYRKKNYKGLATFGVLTMTALSLAVSCSALVHANKVEEPIEVTELVIIQSTSYTLADKAVVVKQEEPTENTDILVDAIMYTSDSVNIREGAGLEYTILDTVDFASSIYVESKCIDSEWYKVIYNDCVGYMHQDYLVTELPLIKVESTAYWNEYNRDSASGRDLIEGKSLAGMICWLGKEVELYECNPDGSVGKYLGTYQFDDTGYGQESGVGSSIILSDKTIGTIENGSCIDIYMNEYMDCIEYGRNDIYMRFVD